MDWKSNCTRALVKSGHESPRSSSEIVWQLGSECIRHVPWLHSRLFHPDARCKGASEPGPLGGMRSTCPQVRGSATRTPGRWPFIHPFIHFIWWYLDFLWGVDPGLSCRQSPQGCGPWPLSAAKAQVVARSLWKGRGPALKINLFSTLPNRGAFITPASKSNLARTARSDPLRAATTRSAQSVADYKLKLQ